MAHTHTGTENKNLVSTEWLGVAAAAGAWWDDAAPANETAEAGMYRDADDVPAVEGELRSSVWPEVAAAAGAWWDESVAPQDDDAVLRRVKKSRVTGVSNVATAGWPGVAAAAGAWWDEPLASGTYNVAPVRAASHAA